MHGDICTYHTDVILDAGQRNLKVGSVSSGKALKHEMTGS